MKSSLAMNIFLAAVEREDWAWISTNSRRIMARFDAFPPEIQQIAREHGIQFALAVHTKGRVAAEMARAKRLKELWGDDHPAAQPFGLRKRA